MKCTGSRITQVVLAVLVAAMLAVPQAGAAQSTLPVSEATGFLGDWRMSVDTGDGAMLGVRIGISDAGGVVATEVETDMGPGKVNSVARAEDSLVVSFDMDFAGTPVDVVISFLPEGENLQGRITAAGGSFTATVTATPAP